jgi:Mn2+/Fe2+ NRAMP family transporter
MYESWTKYKALVIFLVCVLVLSFGIHIIDTHHHDSSAVLLSDYFHASDKKWELILLLLFISFLPSLFIGFKIQSRLFYVVKMSQHSHFLHTFSLFNPIAVAIHSGVIHSQHYE